VSEREVNGRRAARNASALAAVNAALIAMVFISDSPFFRVFLICGRDVNARDLSNATGARPVLARTIFGELGPDAGQQRQWLPTYQLVTSWCAR
jgi:hypothetical protein